MQYLSSWLVRSFRRKCKQITLFMLGIGYYAADLFLTNAFEHHYSEYYNIFLSSIGIGFLLWFIIDLNRFIKMINKLTDKCAGLKLVEGLDGEFHIEIPVAEDQKTLPEYYGLELSTNLCTFHGAWIRLLLGPHPL